jgi:hypothetical protein
VEVARLKVPLEQGKDSGENQNERVVQAMTRRCNPYDFSFFPRHVQVPLLFPKTPYMLISIITRGGSIYKG